jgi:hypothetical protein
MAIRKSDTSDRFMTTHLGGEPVLSHMKQTAARPKNGRALQDPLPTRRNDAMAAAQSLFSARNGHTRGLTEACPNAQSVDSARRHRL